MQLSNEMKDLLELYAKYPHFFESVGYFFTTFIGAVITQLLSLHYGTVGANSFLKHFFPNKDDNWYYRANCITLITVGTILSFVILEPESVKASFCAGLTWCGTLQSLGLVGKREETL